MRCFVVIVLAAALLVGCKSAEKKKETPPKKTTSARVLTNTAPAAPAPSPGRPSVRPIDALSGRIIAVREPLRFVIVDFPNRRMPKPEQRLSVYRLDQKVAEIKISGPYLNTTVAADVTAGEAREGDLVKEE
ncbi:MAG TPA: hypothetical protein VGR78_17150 [Verrucomicrobiae bacterium]|jgi:hypothetical protein|nr:hypothetical protein [Verrucomicrobiae bacterium]